MSRIHRRTPDYGLVGAFICRNYESVIGRPEKDVTIDIDARKRGKDQYLDRVMGEMNIGGSASGADDDLLDLMDQA